jgi:hypothetical protein
MDKEIRTVELTLDDVQDIIKAVEFRVSSAYTKPESWQYIRNIWCMDYFYEEERPSCNDMSDYNEWLDYTKEDDTDESYSRFVNSVKSYWLTNLCDIVIKEDIEINVVYPTNMYKLY